MVPGVRKCGRGRIESEPDPRPAPTLCHDSMRRSVVVGFLASLAACAPASIPSVPLKLASRAALPPAAEAPTRNVVFAVHWTSLAHQPLVDRLHAILRATDGAEIACNPRLSGSFSAACDASGPAAGLSALEIVLPPELAGPLAVPLDGRERRVAVDAWLAMAEGEQPILDTVTFRRDRPPPPGLELRRLWTPASGGFGQYELSNRTDEPLSLDDMWLETSLTHERWRCLGCGNVGSAPPLQPGETGYLSMHLSGGAYACTPPATAKPDARHRYVVRLIGASRPIELSPGTWRVRPPRLTERRVYELADEFELDAER